MGLSYGFYDSLNGDRRYNAEQMSSIFDGIIEDGVYMNVGDRFSVSAISGMSVGVGTGRAWFNHTWSYNDALVSFVVPTANPVNPRRDLIVIEVDRRVGVRANTLRYLTGTASATPVDPALSTVEEVYQYPIARISVGVGVTEITQGSITSLVGFTACPYVKGVLTGMSIDSIVANWELQFLNWSLAQQEEFLAWFSAMQGQLTEDAAGALQAQIDALAETLRGGWNDLAGITFTRTSATKMTSNQSILSSLRSGDRIKIRQNSVPRAVFNFNEIFNASFTSDGYSPSDPTIVGTPTLTPGKYGNALTLDSGDELQLSATGARQWLNLATISFWIKTASVSAGNIYRCSQAYSDPGINISLFSDGTLRFEMFRDDTTNYLVVSTIPLNDNQWHHVVITRDTVKLYLYIDGELNSSNNSASTWYIPTVDIEAIIGGAGFVGQLDELVFAKEKFQPELIKSIYESPVGFPLSIEHDNHAILMDIEDLTEDVSTLYLHFGYRYSMPNLPILAVSYSKEYSPMDFDISEDIWEMISYIPEFPQNNPVYGTQYEIGWDFAIPRGIWKSRALVGVEGARATSGEIDKVIAIYLDSRLIGSASHTAFNSIRDQFKQWVFIDRLIVFGDSSVIEAKISGSSELSSIKSLTGSARFIPSSI